MINKLFFKYPANGITTMRLILAVILLFVPLFCIAFYILYIICGLSDILDGLVARHTNTESDLGSKLDSVADLIFFIICAIKLLPILTLSPYIWIYIAILAILKVINLLVCFIYKKSFVIFHNIYNKLTGLLLFILPLVIKFTDINIVVFGICIASTFAVIKEILLM